MKVLTILCNYLADFKQNLKKAILTWNVKYLYTSRKPVAV
jgi:hypothetical protein